MTQQKELMHQLFQDFIGMQVIIGKSTDLPVKTDGKMSANYCYFYVR